MISVRHSHHDCRGTAHGHVINFVKEGREEKGHRRGWRRNCNRGWECPKKQKHKKKGQQMNMWFMTEFFVLFPFLPLLKRFGCCQNKWLYTFAPNIHCQFVCIYIYMVGQLSTTSRHIRPPGWNALTALFWSLLREGDWEREVGPLNIWLLYGEGRRSAPRSRTLTCVAIALNVVLLSQCWRPRWPPAACDLDHARPRDQIWPSFSECLIFKDEWGEGKKTSTQMSYVRRGKVP